MTKNLFVLVLATAVLASACRRDEQLAPVDTSATATVATSLDESATVSPSGPVELETTVGTTVLVVLEDTTIGLPTMDIPPGPTSFTVTNSGTQVHDLTIEGGGGAAVELDGTLSPGESKTMTMLLRPGTYEVYCPILDHRAKGQSVTLTIPAR